MHASKTDLVQARRALLEKRLQKAKQSRARTIGRRPEGEPMALSFAQQRLWFLAQLEPDNPAYNTLDALRLTGQLDVAALERALNEIIRRHQVLHMVYVASDEGTVHMVPHPEPRLDLKAVDLSALPAPERESKVRRLIAQAARRPFDLARELPIRAALWRLGEVDPQDLPSPVAPPAGGGDEHVLLLVVHHIATDGWSLSVFVKELQALYGAFCAGKPSPLPELPIQYADFAHWQRNWLRGEVLDRQVGYWERQLAGAPSVLELPADHPRPAVMSSNGAMFRFHLPADVTEALRALAQDEGGTPFMALLAAFQVLLHRYTGQTDFVVGCPIAGRNRSEIEGLIGVFINTLVLRADLSGHPTGRELLRRTRQVTLDAYDHQDVPFEKLVEELQPERNLSHNPFFQALFLYQNLPWSELELPGVTISRLDVDPGTSKVDLSLVIEEQEGQILGTVIYNTDLFNLDTIERLATHYRMIVQGLVAHPEKPVTELQLLTPAERAQLDAWCDTRVDYPPVPCIHQLFEEQVARTPDAVAVIFEGGRYTYRELNRRANRVAHYLQRLGVGPDVRVGLLMERSLDVLVGLIGILKAGGAYVPLDPIYPQERIRFMLEDVQVPILVTQAHLAAELPALGDVRVVRLDGDWETIAQHSPHNPPIRVVSSNLIYVLFTSGSTGRPKGVAVEHRNYLNYFYGVVPRLKVKPGMHFAMVSTFSTDLGTIQFWAPLTTGGTAHVVSYERATDPEAMIAYFRQHTIDVLKLVPSHFEAWQGAPGAEIIVPRHLVIFTGEPSHWETVDRIKALNPDCMVQDHYGVTETTCATLVYVTPDALPETHAATLPLGRPLGNVRVHVLDPQMAPCPVNVLGELYIGGFGVTRGYIGRPQLTAERFVPDPFSDVPGARLYRTGDLATYRAGGSLKLLGRMDFQVKIRGYRVETGEIESLLCADPAVRDAVVVAREDPQGDRRLVAYVVPRPASNGNLSVDALRAGLRERLPDYMVPSAFVTLDALPLNPNGKVDRFALPAPEYARLGGGAGFVAPRDEIETHIAACWSQVLGVEKVGIDDDFFDLGGESFKAIRAVRKIGETVSVIELFKYPTIRELARRLRGEEARSDGLLHELTGPISAQDEAFSLVCVPYGGGSAVVFQPLADALPENGSLYAVQLPGHDFARRDEPLEPLEAVARRCAEEIKRRVAGPIVLYGHCVGGALAVEIARLLEQEQVEVCGVVLGGTFPSPRLPGKFFDFLTRTLRIDRWQSNRAIYDTLRALGGFADLSDPEEKAFVLACLRHDVQETEDYCTAALAAPEFEKLRAPILCIVGERDRATEFYEERYREWAYFGDTVDLAVISRAGHYFLKHQTEELAEILTDRIDLWQNQTEQTATHSGVQEAQVRETVHEDGPRPVAQRRPSLSVFFLVALGQFISLIGTGLTAFALGVWVYQETGSVLDLGAVWFFVALPGVLFSPLAGVVADRWDRRKVMIWSDTAAACGTLALLVLLWAGELQLVHIYLVTVVGSIANTFQQPAYTAAVTQLVPKQYLGHANGIVQFAGAAGRLLAPLLGGALVVGIGLRGVVLIDLLTFLFAIVTLLLVRFPDVLFRRREEPVLKEIVGGWSYVLKRHGLLIMVGLFAVTNLLQSIVVVLLTPLVLLFATTATLGNVMAVNGVGMLLGGLVMGVWGGTRRRTEGILGFMGLLGLCVIVMGLRPSPLYVALGLFGAGAAITLANAHWLALIQAKVGLELQGRVLATDNMVSLSMQPLGFILTGPLYERVFAPLMAEGGAAADNLGWLVGVGPGSGMALMIVLSGALSVGLAIWGYRYRRLRYMEDDLPDAIPDAVIVADKDAIQAQADRQFVAEAA